ncbi:MAG: dihydroorotase [Campylobacterales bacterium]|nr:dihydroorotase [Campylobacterales bacterium]
MIISNATVCDVNGVRRCDLRIEEGLICEIAPQIEGADRLELEGAYLLPSLVDTNVRPRDAQISGVSLQRLALEALRGGVGTAVLLGDTNPSIDNEIVLEFVQNQHHQEEGATLEASVASINTQGGMSNIAILLKKGAVALYVRSSAKNNLFCRIAEYAKMCDVTLFVRAEDESLAQDGVMNEGEVAGSLGLVGISPLSEILHVSRFIELARHYDIRIVFKSIAQPRSLELIGMAKNEGIRVQAEVGLHHLMRSDRACIGFNTAAKIDPPLLCDTKMHALRDALISGKIDMLTLLQHAQSPVNKDHAFAEAAYGSDSISDALSLYYTFLIASDMIDWPTLLSLTCKATAASIGREAGVIREGMRCDMVAFDPTLRRSVENTGSLYHGETLHGAVRMAFVGDRIVTFS